MGIRGATPQRTVDPGSHHRRASGIFPLPSPVAVAAAAGKKRTLPVAAVSGPSPAPSAPPERRPVSRVANPLPEHPFRMVEHCVPKNAGGVFETAPEKKIGRKPGNGRLPFFAAPESHIRKKRKLQTGKMDVSDEPRGAGRQCRVRNGYGPPVRPCGCGIRPSTAGCVSLAELTGLPTISTCRFPGVDDLRKCSPPHHVLCRGRGGQPGSPLSSLTCRRTSVNH